MAEKINLYKVCADIGELKGTIKQMNDTLNRIMENHGKRINDLERTTDTIVGKVSVTGAIFGFIGGIIVMIIGYFIKK